MINEKTKIGITFLIYFLSSVPLLIGCGVTELATDYTHKNWMNNLKDDAKLSEIIMLGSHDAGSVGMTPMAETQGSSIADQLKIGARYFDLRVNRRGDNLVMYHGPAQGQLFSIVLQELQDFINNHPSEFLILDFQHFGNNVEDEVTALINKNLNPSSYALKTDENIMKITYGEIKTKGYRYAIAWRGKNIDSTSGHYWIRSSFLDSPYDPKINSLNGNRLITGIDSYFETKKPNVLFVLQMIGRSPCPLNHENRNTSYYSEYIKELANDKEKLAKVNVIMRDYVTSTTTNVDDIINLNEVKGLFRR